MLLSCYRDMAASCHCFIRCTLLMWGFIAPVKKHHYDAERHGDLNPMNSGFVMSNE